MGVGFVKIASELHERIAKHGVIITRIVPSFLRDRFSTILLSIDPIIKKPLIST